MKQTTPNSYAKALYSGIRAMLRQIGSHGIAGYFALAIAALLSAPIFALVRLMKSIIEGISIGEFTVTRNPARVDR